jgi:hypothetical protein
MSSQMPKPQLTYTHVNAMTAGEDDTMITLKMCVQRLYMTIYENQQLRHDVVMYDREENERGVTDLCDERYTSLFKEDDKLQTVVTSINEYIKQLNMKQRALKLTRRIKRIACETHGNDYDHLQELKLIDKQDELSHYLNKL